ncbi:hypothetical protein [Micromonospora sp. WMMD718]|uniref:hypothetical protein n=1 Tax=unclassified Micromonospora TaxID=2617518 RepID=UPI001F192835
MAPAARREVREAYERLRRYFIVALQAGLAAGLAWYVASTLLKNPQVVVALLLLPLNPVRVVHRAAGPTLDLFANELTAAAKALAARDAGAARP